MIEYITLTLLGVSLAANGVFIAQLRDVNMRCTKYQSCLMRAINDLREHRSDEHIYTSVILNSH
jgi:hypothetical protein